MKKAEKRLIDASEIPELLEKEFVRKWRLVLDGEKHLDNLAEGFFGAKNVVQAMPTVDAVEVVHGRWLRGYPIHCSVCGGPAPTDYEDCNRYEAWLTTYCPNCGAKMDKNENP